MPVICLGTSAVMSKKIGTNETNIKILVEPTNLFPYLKGEIRTKSEFKYEGTETNAYVQTIGSKKPIYVDLTYTRPSPIEAELYPDHRYKRLQN